MRLDVVEVPYHQIPVLALRLQWSACSLKLAVMYAPTVLQHVLLYLESAAT